MTHEYEDIKTISDSQYINWDKLQSSTVLITGASGFIAYYLVCALLIRNDLYNSNIKILALARSEESIQKKYGEILNRSDIKVIINDVCNPIECEPADYVIHAASQASPYFFENDPVGTIEANLIGVSNVLKYAQKETVKSVLYISSLKVYGSFDTPKSELFEEDMGTIDYSNYKNCYAIGKRTGETVCSCYYKQYKLPIKIARPSYIYGATNLSDDRVWAQFISNVVQYEDILLKSNGSAYRSFCYVTDTAIALLKILLDGQNIIPYNISNTNSNVTIRSFAKAAVEAFPERNLKLKFANKNDETEPEILSETKNCEILNSNRLNDLGWKPEVDLASGIKKSVKIVEFCRE